MRAERFVLIILELFFGLCTPSITLITQVLRRQFIRAGFVGMGVTKSKTQIIDLSKEPITVGRYAKLP
jgi:hypothetical protein